MAGQSGAGSDLDGFGRARYCVVCDDARPTTLTAPSSRIVESIVASMVGAAREKQTVQIDDAVQETTVNHDREAIWSRGVGYQSLGDRVWSARFTRNALVVLLAVLFLVPIGCEMDSYLDPSRTGRFMHTPTTIPVLERIDVIEEDFHPWGETTEVLPDDLIPSDLTYVFAPGDFVTIEIFEGFEAGQWRPLTRRIDASGSLRLPDIGDVRAAGLTQQELEDLIRERMAETLVIDPHVNVVLEEGTALTFTLEGLVQSPGMFQIRRADFRLSEALALAGGLARTAQTIYVVRRVPLTEEILPIYDRDRRPDDARDPAPRDRRPAVDIDDLIDDLRDEPSPAMLPGRELTGRAMPVDVDDLEPVRMPREAPVDVDDAVDDRRPARPQPEAMFLFDEERGEWVRGVQRTAQQPGNDRNNDAPLVIERIIEIPAQSVRKGVGRYDIVVRPKDRIIIEGPEPGTVYISGEINRPGVYNMPLDGGRLTLSRLVAAAGDLGGVAVPERVDLVRKVGPNREATVRLDLAAIRRRTEPDVYLRPDDHVIIGTSFWATPLAVIRNGFRATYGFGFLLDRNFGNDVFGAPPVRRLE